MLNLMQVFGPNNLRNVNAQIKYIDPKDKQANQKRCFTLEALSDSFNRAGIILNDETLDTLNHPLVTTLGEWHSTGQFPPRTGFAKFALYPAAIYYEEPGAEVKSNWCVIDFDLHKHEVDDAPRRERLTKIITILNANHIPFLWSWSRSGGIHIWVLFAESISRMNAVKLVNAIKNIIAKAGIFTSEEGGKIDTRPSGQSGREAVILLPNNTIYPISILHNQHGNKVTSIDNIEKLDPNKSIEKSTTKAEKKPKEPFDEKNLPKRIHTPQFPITLSTEQDRQNLANSHILSSGLNLTDLSPCIRHMALNKVAVPDGQFNHTTFAVAQEIGSLHKGENFEDALEQLTDVMNLLGSHGGHHPESQDYYATTLKSAYSEFNKGICLGCGFNDGDNIMRNHCNSIMCRKVYERVQEVKADTSSKILWLKMMDPLANQRVIATVIPHFFLREQWDWQNPKNWPELFLEFSPRELQSVDAFQSATRSGGRRNLDKYSFNDLIGPVFQYYQYW